MRPITLVERGYGSADLLNGLARLHPPDDAQERGAAHHPFVRKPWNNERLGRPDFIALGSDPVRREIRNHAHDGVRDAVQRDAAAEYVRVAVHALPPEFFRDQSNVGAFLFLREKNAAANWGHAKHVEPVRRYFEDCDLDWITQAGEGAADSILRRQAVEDGLPVAIIHVARRRDRKLRDPLLLRVREDMDEPIGFAERQPAQEEIVDQAEDCCVQPDPEREGDHR